MKKYKFFLIPLIIILVFSITMNNVLNNKYKVLREKKDISKIKHTYNHIIRDRGGLLKNQMLQEEDLMLLGSSELGSKVKQNPINFFPFDGANYDVSIYGRSHTQTLQHSAILSSTNNLNSKDKIAIIISAQWFDHEPEREGSEFSVNFSELQFYKFFENDKLSNESKKYFAERVGRLLEQSGEYIEETVYAKLYVKDNIPSNIALCILKPYYKFKEYMLETKDKMQTVKALKELDEKNINVKKLRNVNWDEEYKKAEEEGISKVTNNNLNVDDNYYNTYIKENYDKVKDKWKGKELLSAPELNDYELFLNISNELGVKPLIILMPVNGIYYDHLGWTIEKRTEFYNTLESMAKENGFDVLNLQSKEYEKYYLSDVMHLGWKGWLNIDEEMYNYFNKR